MLAQRGGDVGRRGRSGKDATVGNKGGQAGKIVVPGELDGLIHVHAAGVIAVARDVHFLTGGNGRIQALQIGIVDGKVRGLHRGVILVGEGDGLAARLLLPGLHFVPAVEGIGQIGHGLPLAFIGDPDGQAHEIRAVILAAVGKDHDLGPRRIERARRLDHPVPERRAGRIGEIQQHHELMRGLLVAEDHGIDLLAPVCAVGGFLFDALGAAAHLGQHGLPGVAQLTRIGQFFLHPGIEQVGPAGSGRPRGGYLAVRRGDLRGRRRVRRIGRSHKTAARQQAARQQDTQHKPGP